MLFQIKHWYDRDGGFGDAVCVSETLGYAEFDDQDSADTWCKAHDKTHIYDTPYQDLYMGTLRAEPVKVAIYPDEILPDWWEDQIENICRKNDDYYDDQDDGK